MDFGRASLYILFVFPLLILILSIVQISKKKKILLLMFKDEHKIRKYMRIVKKDFFINILFISGVSFLVLSLMLPRWGVESVDRSQNRTNIVFVLDNSYSMLAEDIYPNRLEKAKEIILSIASKFYKKDFLSLFIFAGDSEILVPPTSDFQSFNTYLMDVNPEINSIQGSYLGRALESLSSLACNSLKNSIFIIVSDGESFDDPPREMAQKIIECGNALFFIGIGSTEGAPIPIRNDNFKIIGWKKDSNGQTVITKLNTPLIINMIKRSENYVIINTPQIKDKEVSKKVIKVIKTFKSKKIFVKKADKSLYPLFLAFILLIFYGVFWYGKKK